VFQSLHVPDTPSVSPSKSTKVGKKYGLSKHTSKAKERKVKDRLVVSRIIMSLQQKYLMYPRLVDTIANPNPNAV